MSRIGKIKIKIPEKVEVKIEGCFISVKGPKGELEKKFDDSIKFTVENDEITVAPIKLNKRTKALWGTYRSVLFNMIEGVSKGFEKVLEYKGVGYKAEIKNDSSQPSGQALELKLGFSHDVSVPAPKGVSFKTEKGVIYVSGVDKELVGQVAANIKKVRPVEPYKGKGIRYRGQIVLRKAGKKAVSAGT